MFPSIEKNEKENNIARTWFSFFQDPKSTAVRQSAAHIGVSAGRRTANWSITNNHKSPYIAAALYMR